jgi:hypothetical protein
LSRSIASFVINKALFAVIEAIYPNAGNDGHKLAQDTAFRQEMQHLQMYGAVGAWAEDIQSDDMDEILDTPDRPQLPGAFFRHCAPDMLTPSAASAAAEQYVEVARKKEQVRGVTVLRNLITDNDDEHMILGLCLARRPASKLRHGQRFSIGAVMIKLEEDEEMVRARPAHSPVLPRASLPPDSLMVDRTERGSQR